MNCIDMNALKPLGKVGLWHSLRLLLWSSKRRSQLFYSSTCRPI